MSAREMIEEMVDEMLDEGGPVRIGNLTFYRSEIVKRMDPIAYRIMLTEYADVEIEDLQYEIDRLDPEDDADEIADLRERIAELEEI